MSLRIEYLKIIRIFIQIMQKQKSLIAILLILKWELRLQF